MNFDIVVIDPKSNWNEIHPIINNRMNHEGRVTKKTRDRFYTAIQEDKNVVVVAALVDGVIVGISGAILTKKMAHNSFTIVRSTNRKQKIGRQLLAAKILAMWAASPNTPLTCYVGAENAAGAKICALNNLSEVGTRKFNLKDGKEITAKVFSNAAIA